MKSHEQLITKRNHDGIQEKTIHYLQEVTGLGSKYIRTVYVYLCKLYIVHSVCELAEFDPPFLPLLVLPIPLILK